MAREREREREKLLALRLRHLDWAAPFFPTSRVFFSSLSFVDFRSVDESVFCAELAVNGLACKSTANSNFMLRLLHSAPLILTSVTEQ